MREVFVIVLALATAGNAWVGWMDKRRIHKVIAVIGALALVLEFLR